MYKENDKVPILLSIKCNFYIFLTIELTEWWTVAQYIYICTENEKNNYVVEVSVWERKDVFLIFFPIYFYFSEAFQFPHREVVWNIMVFMSFITHMCI